MENENVCKLCGEKLENKESSALFFCLKCSEQKLKLKQLLIIP